MNDEQAFLNWLFTQTYRNDAVGALSRAITDDYRNECLSSLELRHVTRIVQHTLDCHNIDLANAMSYAIRYYQARQQQAAPEHRFRIWRRKR